jgi:UDP-N-acetyl-D-mannosaminuronic acid transferase (WecB/TagA/CpsF family)
MNNNDRTYPPRYNLFGVNVSATDYQQAEEAVIAAAGKGVAATVAHMPVHGLMIAVSDENFMNAL